MKGEIGVFGGGSLEQPRPWLGSTVAGAPPWECRAAWGQRACPEGEGVQEPSRGTAKECIFGHAARAGLQPLGNHLCG